MPVRTFSEAEVVLSHRRRVEVPLLATVWLGVAAFALAEGSAFYFLATTLAGDVTGILVAGLFAALGLFVIPARRRQAKADMRDKVAALRLQLVRSLRTQFEREIEHSLQHINEAIAPYTRFVRAERAKMLKTHEQLERVHREASRLRTIIEQIS